MVEVACDYTKRKHVFRLNAQAMGAELLLQAEDANSMKHWVKVLQEQTLIPPSANEPASVSTLNNNVIELCTPFILSYYCLRLCYFENLSLNFKIMSRLVCKFNYVLKSFYLFSRMLINYPLVKSLRFFVSQKKKFYRTSLPFAF